MDDLLRPVPLGMGGVRDGKLPTVWAEMIQLTMDSQTQQYKVFVAGYVKCGYRHFFAQVYDSKTKGWTIVGSEQRSWERISGCECTWENNHGEYTRGMRKGPSVYDFAGDGRLQSFGGSTNFFGGRFDVLKDRLFLFNEQERVGPANMVPTHDLGLPPKFCIGEYHLQRNGHAWAKVDTHGCSPFDGYCSEEYFRHDHRLRRPKLLAIYACNQFLMVLPKSDALDEGWFYDLCTREWRKLPKLGDHVYNGPVHLMCELRWDAVP